jgi:hypothetical protein
MALKSEVDQQFLALVESGNIRYAQIPAAPVACAVAAWAQLAAAAATPAVPWWICGFKISVATGVVAEQGWTISVGYGGADGAAVAATTVVITAAYCGLIGAAAAAMGGLDWLMLPYPVKVPVDQVDPGSRLAYSCVANPVGAALGTTACYVLIATAIGG